ncbi:MAG TPA: hypothetical protein ENL08_05315, partial [Bacteroidetes bacterium]|nr:hypothetical protein [Bacteroidota bacterium]
ASWELLRPVNLVITALTVWVGGIIAGGVEVMLNGTLLCAAFAAALVAAGGNAINDAYDEDVDQLNRPDRPIPSGRLDYVSAFKLGGGISIFGIIISYLLKPGLGIIALCVALLLWVYSVSLKRTILLGNFAVGICGGLAFIFGALAVDNPAGGMYPALFAFLIHIGREIVKDIEDVSGDRLCGAMTLPVVAGGQHAQRVAAFMLMMLATAVFIPYWTGDFSRNYFYIMLTAVDLPLMLIILFLLIGVEQRGLKRVSAALKLIMIAGLVALYIG